MLNAEAKKNLKTTVLHLRSLLEGDFDPDSGAPVLPGGDIVRQLLRYGISFDKPESTDTDKAPSYLTEAERTIRKRICAAIKREATIFGSPEEKTAFQRGFRAFVRETSYTWLNRLLGLRCIEARGLLKDDQGEADFVVTPSDDYGGLPRRTWRIKGQEPVRWQNASVYDLQCAAISDACRQLTGEIKILFDPDHDYSLIRPSPSALNTILQKIIDLDSRGKDNGKNPFQSPDFLGWVYQYFQTREKDQIFEAASKKRKKIEKDDIIAATQIYTEHYMVEYLVQNTLGRLWMEMHPDSGLSSGWAYYVKPAEGNAPVERPLKKVIDLKLMDPALGSGHFHLVAFDLLYAMYEEEIENKGKPGWPETPSVSEKSEIPVSILEHNLFGTDIDLRAIQLATLALWMKARETGCDQAITKIHFVPANSAPFESETWHKYIRDLNNEGKFSVARVLAALGIQLANLSETGSLLRVEKEMEKVIQEEKKNWLNRAWKEAEQLFISPAMAGPGQLKLPYEQEITDETFFDRLGPIIEKELDKFYLTARQKGLAEEAILAADAERGFEFFRLISRRYDVVFTNPPYMGSKNMGERLKKFVAGAYPQGKRDLYAAFILRCRELTGENGYVGMVTQQSWMFLRSFADLRALPAGKLSNARGAFTGLLRETTIETLAHLGPRAFSEISGEVVNIVLFTLRNHPPVKEHRLAAFRLVGPKSPEEKASLLEMQPSSVISRPYQKTFLHLTDTPLIYYIGEELLGLMTFQKKLSDLADVKAGIGTGYNDRHLRYFFEVNENTRWRQYVKGGGYGKWTGYEWYVVNWQYGINSFDKEPGHSIRNVEYIGREGFVYTLMASGALGLRILNKDCIFDKHSIGVFPKSPDRSDFIVAFCNSRIASYFARAFAQGIVFQEGYVASIPIPQYYPAKLTIARLAILLKSKLVSSDPIEWSFCNVRPSCNNATKVWLHTIEGFIEKSICTAYGLSDATIEKIFVDTGIPAGWFPIITGYDGLPEFCSGLTYIPQDLIDHLAGLGLVCLSPEELDRINNRLRVLYTAGPGAKVEEEKENPLSEDENDEQENAVVLGARIPIPAETFLEELSQKLEIHPVSVYWLLKEMREKEGLVCPSEMKRQAEDYVSVIILRMLGYQWPKQIETKEPLPDWADKDGIIPLTEGLGEPTLLDHLRQRFGADFGEEKEAAIESEFANIVGKSLERWLDEDFFARHVKQFKNRPIAWHIVSSRQKKPAFSVMIHYHRFADREKGYQMLQILRNRHLERLISQIRMELETLKTKGDGPKIFDRLAELDRKLIELEGFRDRLERVQDGTDREARIHVRWKSSQEQPKGWRPDINDGVRVNIAPWERLGVFPIKKIVGQVEMQV